MKELLGTLTLAGEATSKLPHYQNRDGRWVHLKGISRWNSSMKTSIHKRGGENDQFLTRRDNCVDFDGGVEWYNCCSIEDQGQGSQNRATRYACFGNWPVSVKPTQYLARRKTERYSSIYSRLTATHLLYCYRSVLGYHVWYLVETCVYKAKSGRV